MKFFIIGLLCFFHSQNIAKVRGVETDSNAMKTIVLAMGRSTILQFVDKPKKIVSGNSNYFNIEFIGNDVTIQPLALVSSNLFIYSGQRRFGFILKVCKCNKYDDLVKVYWKSPKVQSKPKSIKKEFKKHSFLVGKTSVFITKVFYHRFNDVYIIDGSFVLDKKSKKPNAEDFWITKSRKKLNILDVIFTEDMKFKKYRNIRFRIFVKLARPISFTLRAKIKGKKGYTIISKKAYR